MKSKQQAVIIREDKNINRKGVHAKSKTSKLKTSKNYVKPYKGQGK